MKSENPNYRERALHSVAAICAGVTSISVAVTVFDLFGGGGIGMLFAVGASALDLYKVLAFSTVVGIFACQRYATGVAALVVAVALGFFSAWATSEFLSGAILSKRNHAEALHTQRTSDIKAASASDAARISALDKAEAEIRSSVAGMRTRGQATKAAEVEASELPKISAEREILRARIDAGSQELTKISAEVPKGFALSVDAILAIARGFAVFLEITPAVIMAATQKSKNSQNLAEFQSDFEEIQPPPRRKAPSDLELLDDLRQVPAGRVVSMTEYAKSRRIGQERAVRVFGAAVDAGILTRGAGRSYVRAMPALRVAGV